MGARAPQLPAWFGLNLAVEGAAGTVRSCATGLGCASSAWGRPGGLVLWHGLAPRSAWLPGASSEPCCSWASPLVEAAKGPHGPSFSTSGRCEMFPAQGGSPKTHTGRLGMQLGAPRGHTDLWLSKPAPFPEAAGSCVPHSCALMPCLAFCSRRTKSIL